MGRTQAAGNAVFFRKRKAANLNDANCRWRLLSQDLRTHAYHQNGDGPR
jgi:hypothetical protein